MERVAVQGGVRAPDGPAQGPPQVRIRERQHGPRDPQLVPDVGGQRGDLAQLLAREDVRALEDGEQRRPQAEVVAEVPAQHPHRVARQAPHDQDAAERRPQAPAAPLRVAQPAARPVEHETQELEDGLAVDVVPQHEPAPAQRGQHEVEHAPALVTPDRQHVRVVDVGRQCRRAGPEADGPLPVADQHVRQPGLPQRLAHALGDGLVAEVEGPRPAHGHPEEAGLEDLGRVNGVGGLKVVVEHLVERDPELVGDAGGSASVAQPEHGRERLALKLVEAVGQVDRKTHQLVVARRVELGLSQAAEPLLRHAEGLVAGRKPRQGPRDRQLAERRGAAHAVGPPRVDHEPEHGVLLLDEEAADPAANPPPPGEQPGRRQGPQELQLLGAAAPEDRVPVRLPAKGP